MKGHPVVRPLLVTIMGWAMATNRVEVSHSDDYYSAVLMHPAYGVFYSMYAMGALVLWQVETTRRGGPEGLFGFVNWYVKPAIAVALAQWATAFGFAWWYRRRGTAVSTGGARRKLFDYCTFSLAAGVVATAAVVMWEVRR